GQVSLLELKRLRTTRREEGRFAEVELEESVDNSTASQFLSLGSPPVDRAVKSFKWLTGAAAQRVAALGDISHLPDATDEELENALGRPSPNAVAVYDVGQGACQALLVRGEPVLYFDVGGGSDRDSKTLPATFNGLCLCADPAIVLSHFHHDHWALVRRFNALFEQTWVVPRQGDSIGFNNAVLAGLIASKGTLLVWPDDVPTRRFGRVTVHRCTGKSRNNSGLALSVGEAGSTILLPGDARYREIANLPEEVLSLVAAHHGGVTNAKSTEIPQPSRGSAGRLVYSYGPDNSYGHPLTKYEDDHRSIWGRSDLRTASVATCSTAADHSGNIHLHWDSRAPDLDGPVCSPRGAQRPLQR
ncbi:MAG: hypothetical protein Q7T55_22005, partial [Solirubrobacteraceae bacterium]|nr:hypothetical protein [Solirubrobacteraceae bacterium]